MDVRRADGSACGWLGGAESNVRRTIPSSWQIVHGWAQAAAVSAACVVPAGTGKVPMRFPIVFYRMQGSVQKIHGLRHSAEMTLLFMAEALAYTWLILIGGCLWSLLSGEVIGLLAGFGLGALLPVALVKDLHKRSRCVSRIS